MHTNSLPHAFFSGIREYNSHSSQHPLTPPASALCVLHTTDFQPRVRLCRSELCGQTDATSCQV